ncbi:MAG: hypothetical protein WC928_00045 [Patescibacteria group bacterium]|jgi:hypothetical protein
MKLKASKNEVGNYKVFLRRAGYALIFDRRQGVESFVRRLGEGYYPRLHLYAEESGDYYFFNLHLDQKKASYSGFARHSAEYDNDIVSQEINRLKAILGPGTDNINREVDLSDIKSMGESHNSIDFLDRLGSGNLDGDSVKINEDKKRKRFLFF